MNPITLTEVACQSKSDRKLFGLCDDPPPAKKPAYINVDDGARWITVVVNEDSFEVTFTAVDNCIEIKRADGTMDSRCDGILSYNSTVVFVELKQRGGKGNDWVTDAEGQLKASIGHFEKTVNPHSYTLKKAYVSNSEHPKFKHTQARRMDQFQIDTGYTLRIENRIILT